MGIAEKSSQNLNLLFPYIIPNDIFLRACSGIALAGLIGNKIFSFKSPQYLASATDILISSSSRHNGPGLNRFSNTGGIGSRSGIGSGLGSGSGLSKGQNFLTTSSSPGEGVKSLTHSDMETGDMETWDMETGVLETDNYKKALIFLIKFVGSKMLASGCNELRQSAYSRVSLSGHATIATRLFEKIHSQDIDSLLSTQGGQLTATAQMGSRAASTLMTNVVNRLLPMLIETGLVMYRLSRHSNHLAGVTMGTVGSYVLFTNLYSNYRVKQRRLMSAADKKLSGMLHESLTNAETIRNFDTLEHETSKYSEAYNNQVKLSTDVATSLALLNFGQQMILNGGLLLTEYMILKKMKQQQQQQQPHLITKHNQTTVGNIVGASIALSQMAAPLHYMGTLYREIKASLAELDKVSELLFDKQSEFIDPPNAFELKANGGALSIKNLTLKSGERLLLDSVSLEIPAGSKVALIGPSGAGKTSLVKLLSRQKKPTSGTIEIDKQNVDFATAKSVRKIFGIVPQDVVLFNTTLRENLIYGSQYMKEEEKNHSRVITKMGTTGSTGSEGTKGSDGSDVSMMIGELKKAIKAASLDSLVSSLPKGLETPVGERGLKLSGGERQRVGIARCLLKNPEILILDEATSQLDPKTEHDIVQSFLNVSEGRTSIIVAHRLSAIKDCDQIFYFDEGKIVERGTHDELINMKDGHYASLWQNNQSS